MTEIVRIDTATAVLPLPAPLLLMLAGAAGLAGLGWRRGRAAA